MGESMPQKQMNIDKHTVWLLIGAGALLLIGVSFYLWGNVVPGGLSGIDEGPGDCLILPQEHCDAGILTTYLGYDAIAFNLPNGTPIYMPFDGAYFNATPEGMNFSMMTLGIPETTSFVNMIGRHAPYFEDGVGVSRGEQLGVSVNDPDFASLGDDINVNFLIYTEYYDINNLFPNQPGQ